MAYNEEHNIEPTSIVKAVHDLTERVRVAEKQAEYDLSLGELPPEEIGHTIEQLEKAMRAAAAELEFEKAALLRDQIIELRQLQQQDEPEWEHIWNLRGKSKPRR